MNAYRVRLIVAACGPAAFGAAAEQQTQAARIGHAAPTSGGSAHGEQIAVVR